MTKDPTLRSQLTCLLKIAAPALLTSIVGNLLFELMIVDFPTINESLMAYLNDDKHQLTPKLILHEGRARLNWLASVFLFFFVTFSFFSVLWSLLRKTQPQQRNIILLLTAILTIIHLIYFSLIESNSSPIHNIFNFSYEILTATHIFHDNTEQIVFFLVTSINLLGITIVPFGILSSCALVNNSCNHLHHLDQQLQTLGELIRFASVVLIAGLIHMQLWLSWPLHLVPEFSHIKEIKEMIMAIVQYWGIYYSLIIAALYFPLISHIQAIQYDLHSRQTSDDGIISTPHLLPNLQTVMTKLPQIVAIFAPMLVGSFSPAFTEIFNF